MNQVAGDLIVTAIQSFISNIEILANKATRLIAMTDSMPGNIGRYVGQYATSQPSSTTTITGLIGSGSKSRQAILSACAILLSDAKNGNYQSIPGNIQIIVSALQSANPAPNQAILVLLELQKITLHKVQLSTQLTLINNALINLIRRNAVSSAASSTSTYQPISQDDAANMRQSICDAIDIEIQVAGDNGEDASYNALRSLRVAVVQDLNNRGSSLATSQLVSTPIPVALLVTAQRLYQDSARYDQLLKASNPIHPAFPQTQFKALI